MNKEIKNAGWLIGGRIINMAISIVVGLWTARYLGPDNYGLINYAQAYITFFTSLCTLGINSIIIKDFIDHPEQQGVTIGTTLFLRAVSSFLSAIMIIGIAKVIDHNEPATIFVVTLCSFALIFQIFDTINYWFQSRYQSKITSLSTITAYIISSIYKIFLLISHKNIFWFALSTSIDYICVAVFQLISYKKSNGPRFSFSKSKAKELLNKSHHYILSGLMVAIYSQIDKFMLKQMLGKGEVGIYSVAVNLSTIWIFVLTAIIDSIYPTIMRLFTTDTQGYLRKNKQLYAIIFYLSIFVSIIFMFFGDYIIKILYGSKYISATVPLKIYTWSVPFSYLGVARNAWIVCENKQKYLKLMYFVAAAVKLFMNIVLIPVFATSGAAFASFITELVSCFIIPSAIPEMRENVSLMFQAISLRNVIDINYISSYIRHFNRSNRK